jgi:lysophospholipase L1-like esterase
MRRIPLLLLLTALLGLGTTTVQTADAADTGQPTAAKAAPRALFFGDSYFVGGGCSPDRTADMAYLAGVELGYRPVVRGAGGTGFVQANPDYDLPGYLGQIQGGELDVKNPRLVVIQGGSNDLAQPVDLVRKNAGKVLKIARSKYPQAMLMLVGPMDTYGGYADSIPIRDALKKVSKRLHVPFIDAMKWTEGHDDLICSDYDHPTYAGHVYLGHLLAQALAERGA